MTALALRNPIAVLMLCIALVVAGLVTAWAGWWSLPFWLILPLAIAGGALFGAGYAAIPGWLQAKRGSHIVITTIMR